MKIFLSLVCICVTWPAFAQKGQYMTAAEYQAQYFSSDSKWQTLWVDKSLRKNIELILDRPFTSLRIRYWGEGHRTAWVLEEIGKELPITAAVLVEDNKILDVSILEYRESRGGEVRHPFFTQQFLNVQLIRDDHYQLDKHIDGITGATLSVTALKKMAKLALFFHQQTPFNQTQAAYTLSPK